VLAYSVHGSSASCALGKLSVSCVAYLHKTVLASPNRPFPPCVALGDAGWTTSSFRVPRWSHGAAVVAHEG
jgi:hypothetical protein